MRRESSRKSGLPHNLPHLAAEMMKSFFLSK
jgi:hypothetical protein